MNPADGLAAPVRTAPSDALETEIIDEVIDSLLRADPLPYVMAFGENGLGVPVPDDTPIASDRIIRDAATALELCLPGDLPAIIDAWQRARELRAAHTLVHLRSSPERGVNLHFVDARHAFGVYLGIFVGVDGRLAAGGNRTELFRPRICSFERDEVSVVRAVDPAVTAVLGWTEAEFVGRRTLDFTHPDDKPLGIAKWMEMLGRPGGDQRLHLRLRHKDGQYIWFEVTNRNCLDDPVGGRVRTTLVDVSERMAATDALRASERLLRELTDALPLGIIQIDTAHRVVYCNGLARDLLANAAAQTLDEQLSALTRADRRDVGIALAALFASGASAEIEVTVDARGTERRCSVTLRALHTADADVTGAILCVTDITERYRLRQELERRARYDELTHCHNRASILEALEAVMRGNGPANGMAVLFVDLNEFKAVNDRHGHAAGDELLRLTAERLLDCVRGGDVVGRLGGDEFLVVCPDVASPDLALEIAGRISATLTRRVDVGSVSLAPSSSVGVAWTQTAVGCDAIVAAADAAMYEAKRRAGGPVLVLG